jgi:tetratricopeptide (TPR) repeat protein/predicted aspartyl protease
MGGRSYSIALAALAALALAACAGPASAECKLMKLAELPITMTGTAPMVTARLNGQDVRLLADSGAFFSMLTPGAVQRLGLKTTSAPFGFYLRGVGGAEDARVTHVKDLSLAGHTLGEADFLVGEGAGGADGMLGENILNVVDVEYDLANGVIRLFKTQGCGSSPLAYWAQGKPYSVVNIEETSAGHRQIKATAKLNGSSIELLFDTGSWRSILTTQAAARAGVKRDSADAVTAGVVHGIGRKSVESWIAPFDSLAIGDEKIEHTRLRVGSIELETADMLLGADFFLSHRILVSNSQRKLYFTYNGGPVFRLDQAPVEPLTATADQPPAPAAAAAAPDADEPKDADGYTRRGDAFLGRRDFARAIADFSKAAELEPKEPKHLVDRAAAHLGNNQPFLASADLDQALTIKSDYVPALLERGRLRLAGRDLAGAQKDFDAAAQADPNARLAIARAYERVNLNEQILSQLDIWIAGHPKDENLPFALNERCRARVLMNRDLDKAQGDCDQANKLKPYTSPFLDTRGLLRLRLGQLDGAIADFNESLKYQPKAAWSLYGRGVAELKKGDKAKADADMQAAAAIAPRLPDEARRLGFTS